MVLEQSKNKIRLQLKSSVQALLETNTKSDMSEEEKSLRLKKIEQKLKNGKKLSPEEIQFIRKYYPEKYPIVMRIQLMRERLEEELKNAKSKEEVQDIYATAVEMVSSKDPYKELILSAYQDAMEEFKKSSDYKKLPMKDEEEKQKWKDEVLLEEYRSSMPEFNFYG